MQKGITETKPQPKLTIKKLVSKMNTTGSGNGSADTNYRHGWQDLNIVEDEIHYLILALFIVAVNCCVIVVVWRCKHLQKSENFLLVSLAFSDLSTGLIGLPLVLVCSASPSDHCMSCYISFTFTRSLSISTILHLLAVALERYTLIVHPFYHRRFSAKNDNWVKIAIVCLWLVSLIVAAAPFAWLRNDSCMKEDNSDIWLVYTITCLVVFFLIPTVSLVYIFGCIFVVARTHIQRQEELTYFAVVHHQEERNVTITRKKARVAMIFMIMWLVFLICWCPYFTLSLIDELEVEIILSEWIWKGTNVLRFLTSLLNPLLYSFLKEDFHEALRLDRVVYFCRRRNLFCTRMSLCRRQNTLHNGAVTEPEPCQQEEHTIHISAV